MNRKDAKQNQKGTPVRSSPARSRTAEWRPGLLPLMILAFLALLPSDLRAAGEISVRAAVERTQVYQGESFLYQIQVRGTNRVEPASLQSTGDFTAEFLGGQDSSSRMVMNVNGQVSEQVNEAYNLNYRITPKRTGAITIPALGVRAGGRTFQTQALSVQVLKPEETQDFKLRMDLSTSRVYIGEPVTLTVTWYLGKDVRNVQFSVPALSMAEFRYAGAGGRPGASQRQVRLVVQNQEILAEQGRGSLEGREYTTVTFRRVLIPERPGSFSLPTATVACEARSGANRPRGFFDDFFDMGAGGGYQRVVTPSNSPRLEVLDVPQQGRPPNFSGNVGRFEMSAKASPTDVRVGDPITLTLRVSGPPYLEGVKPPRLDLQENLQAAFKVPEEMAPGKVEGGGLTFTQTLRAKSPDVKEIPPLDLSYFDSREGAYRVARTAPIPITVQGAREVTAWDAEGGGTTPEAKELLSLAGGISANHEDLDALAPQAWGGAGLLLGAGWALALFLPPMLFLALWIYLLSARRRLRDPGAFLARGAHRRFHRDLRRAGRAPGADVPGLVLDALRGYLGARLRRPPAALTFADSAGPLRERGIGEDALSSLEALFLDCEAQRYAGGASDAEPGKLLGRAEKLVGSLERGLR